MSIFTQHAPLMTKGTWLNIKTGKTRTGEWVYRWGADRFIVDIKGLRRQIVAGEEPQYGNWRLQR